MHTITTSNLDFNTIAEIISSNKKLLLSEEAKKNIICCREYLDKKMATHQGPIYGINTGFGSLCDVVIPDSDLEKLQQNLVMSHACGTGDEVPAEVVKLMLLLKIQALSYGKSGVQLLTVERLIDFYNNDILPVVYQQGSLGASGDLSPLAHMCLPLLGLGEVLYKEKKQPSAAVLKQLNLEAIKLKSAN
jgi:histidine ammonia-lyase